MNHQLDPPGDPQRPRTGVPWYRSLRLHIALAVAVVSLVTAVTVGSLLAVRAAAEARDALRDQALERVAVAAEGYAIDGRLRLGVSVNPQLPPAPLRDSLATGGRASYFDGDSMWAGQRLGPQVLLTTRLDATRLKTADAERRAALWGSALLAVLLASTLAWLSANRVSRRLRQAASAAHRIAAGAPADQAQRVHVGGNDEVAVLTQAIDAMADSLRQRLATEREFTVDVAHELRTPVTGLVSAVELLPESEATGLVRRQVERLRSLVEALLEVSKLDAGQEPVDLVPLDLAQAVRAALPGQDVVTDAPLLVWLDPVALQRILAAVVANALRHGQPPVVVAVDGSEVSVTDAGDGFPADMPETGPLRFHAQGRAKGAGLGLTIAAKRAENMGAVLRLHQVEPGPGAKVTVAFVPADQPMPGQLAGRS